MRKSRQELQKIWLTSSKLKLFLAEQKRRNLQREAGSKLSNFIETVMRDQDSGDYIRLAELHKSWIKHINFCFQKGLYAGILAPWGHGKSSICAIALPLYLLGVNPAERIKLVSNTDTNARKRVMLIRNYILESKDFKKVFPAVRPDVSNPWTQHELYINRDTRAVDPSLEAQGLHSQGTGGRCSVFIFDDPIDNKSLSSAKIRQSASENFKNVWIPRLEPGGRVVYIATRWHEKDLTGELLENEKFCFLIQRVSKDFKCIEEEIYYNGEDYPR